jgi:hypothetical protein
VPCKHVVNAYPSKAGNTGGYGWRRRILLKRGTCEPECLAELHSAATLDAEEADRSPDVLLLLGR